MNVLYVLTWNFVFPNLIPQCTSVYERSSKHLENKFVVHYNGLIFVQMRLLCTNGLIFVQMRLLCTNGLIFVQMRLLCTNGLIFVQIRLLCTNGLIFVQMRFIDAETKWRNCFWSVQGQNKFSFEFHLIFSFYIKSKNTLPLSQASKMFYNKTILFVYFWTAQIFKGLATKERYNIKTWNFGIGVQQQFSTTYNSKSLHPIVNWIFDIGQPSIYSTGVVPISTYCMYSTQ